jgi:hypothetical protein
MPRLKPQARPVEHAAAMAPTLCPATPRNAVGAKSASNVVKALNASADAKQRNDVPGSALRSLSSALPANVLAELDDRQVLELFTTYSTNAAMLDIVRAGLPDLMAAIVSSAMVPGRGGYNDRMALFRMMGVPWTPHASSRGEANNQVDALANRFVRAISRVESRLSGRLPVAQDAVLVLEAATEPPETV